jgi:uncharacterized protein (UPF0261 family)
MGSRGRAGRVSRRRERAADASVSHRGGGMFTFLTPYRRRSTLAVGLALEAMSSHEVTVVVLGTLDTKGAEYAYLCDRLREHGVAVVLVDAGVLDEPLVEPDVTRREVAEAAGADIEQLAAARDRAAALEAMGRGAAEIARRLHAEGRLDGVAGLGGTGGSSVATAAMRAVPLGTPKLMVSTVAAGDTRPYVGGTDVTLMYAVTDIAGINRISARILSNAAAAIAGMARSRNTPPLDGAGPLVGASMFGITMPCVNAARTRLEELGYEVVVFHQTGTGGRSLEELIESGLITAVLDVTTTELADELVGGICPAVPGRLETAGRLGIPQVVALGALDFVCMGPLEKIPERFTGRTFHRHTPEMVGMRTSPDECADLGRTIAHKLNAATGPTALFVPLRGVSLYATAGQVFHDAPADEALFASLREHVDRERVEVHELDVDINDQEFALAMAERLHEFHLGTSRGR